MNKLARKSVEQARSCVVGLGMRSELKILKREVPTFLSTSTEEKLHPLRNVLQKKNSQRDRNFQKFRSERGPAKEM